MLTFLEVGFAANLVQGFRVYAWRAVPSFPQIALCFPSFALWPQPFWILHADLTIHFIFFSYITVGRSIVGFTLHADYRIKKWQYELHSAWKKHAEYILSMHFVVFFNRGAFVFIWRILLQMDFRHNLRVFCMQFSHVKMGSNAVWHYFWLWWSSKKLTIQARWENVPANQLAGWLAQ